MSNTPERRHVKELLTPEARSPNLFAHSPHGRIRGAFPARLLSWADAAHEDTDSVLHSCGRWFLESLLTTGGLNTSLQYRGVQVQLRLWEEPTSSRCSTTGPVVVIVDRLDAREPFNRTVSRGLSPGSTGGRRGALGRNFW